MARTVTVVEDGVTVDLLVWRELGRTAGAVEQVLDANPGLADLGLVLPLLTAVVLPDGVEAPAVVVVPFTRLWD